MLEAINLTKKFDQHTALDGLTFTVEAGAALCLLGANGAGKSTTLNLFLHFLEASEGQALIEGIDVAKNPDVVRRAIMYLPEQMNLYPQFSAVENLLYLAEISAVSVTDSAIRAALTEVGLQAVAHDQRLSVYSKGMRQKVGIAFAILKNAKALLLDEPTSGLDPSATREFISVIQRLKSRGTAVLMVTHDLHCALSLADTISIMRAGKVRATLSTEALSLAELEATYFQVMDTNAA